MKRNLQITGCFVALIFLGIDSAALVAQQTADPGTVIGRDNCAQCHGNELKAWEQSSHNQKAWSLLDHPKAAEFATAIGVTDIKGDSACTQCHGTHQTIDSKLNILPGNSCESCHGGAGGTDGWLQTHYDFGLGKTVDNSTTMTELLADRLKESKEHRAQRDADCLKAGMNRSDNPVAIAKNCLSCHLVPNEALLKAGHPISASFELVEWSNGEIRHNFLLDQSKNNEVPTNWQDEFRNGPGRTITGRKRLTYVAGKLADLETSLRIRAKVTSTKRGTLGDEINDRILDIQDELEDFNVEELEQVSAAIKDVKKKTLKAITDEDKQKYVAIADEVAKSAHEFATSNTAGDRLPDTIKVRDKVKGEPYSGN